MLSIENLKKYVCKRLKEKNVLKKNKRNRNKI